MEPSLKGINIIKHFEGFETEAYQCPAQVWTIGYGHTRTAKPGMRITPYQGESLLKLDLLIYAKAINHYVTAKGISLNPNQFDALLSLVYNTGPHAIFTKQYDNGYPSGSTLYNKLLEGKYFAAGNRFPDFCKVNGRVNQGLVRRRRLERRLFLEPIY